MYEERASRVPGAVVWRSTSEGAATRVLPDGCLDLLWGDGTVRIAGPDTRAELHRSPAGTEIVGLRFAPGFGPRVLGLPADELTDERVPLDAVWSGSAVRRLVDRLGGAADPGAVLEAVSLDAVGPADPADELVDHVVHRVRAGASVGDVAVEVGFSSRQLHRRSLQAFGYGPKLLARILRLQEALALVRSGSAFAEAAAGAGYADQAHLARNVRELAGVPLGQLVASPSPASGSAANRSTPLPSGSSTEA